MDLGTTILWGLAIVFIGAPLAFALALLLFWAGSLVVMFITDKML